MTVGFAVATSRHDVGTMVGIIADSRLSNSGTALSDSGIKTYELGGRVGMVAAGNALPAITAADIVRPLISENNRNKGKPLGFYDSTRLLAFFLRKASEEPRWSCQTIVAGFLENDTACLALVTVSPDCNTVRFFSPPENGTEILAVGNDEAKNFLMQGLVAAQQEGLPIVSSGLSLIRYMSHLPAFPSVGGGLSMGVCQSPSDTFSWPHVEIEDRRYMRGFDVTDLASASWPPAQHIDYDEHWCAEIDRRINQDQTVFSDPEKRPGGSYKIDEICSPDSLFCTHDDPQRFSGGLAQTSG